MSRDKALRDLGWDTSDRLPYPSPHWPDLQIVIRRAQKEIDDEVDFIEGTGLNSERRITVTEMENLDDWI